MRAYGMQLLRLLLAAVLGLLTVLAFAPWGYWPLAVLAPMGLLALMRHGGAWRVFAIAWAFGAAFFSFGLHWIYISVNVNSPQPAPPWLAILVVAALTIPMGLFFAIPAAIAARIARHWSLVGRMLLLVAALVLFEWLRSWLFTGFPWLSLGFSQIDAPLVGYAPLGGVHAVSLMAWLSAAMLVLLIWGRWNTRAGSVAFGAAIWVVGFLLMPVEWSEDTDQQLEIALVQGNIPQKEKWQPQNYLPTLQKYKRLSDPKFGNVDLIIWPEVAIPGLYNDALPGQRLPPPSYLQALQNAVADTGTDLILGATWLADGSTPNDYGFYNAVVQVPADDVLPPSVYFKRHLVPFGEYSPLPDSFTEQLRSMGLPTPNTLAGPDQQSLITIDDVPLGISICYEDVFARDVLLDLPTAEVLVNVSNDSWFAINQTAQSDFLAGSWFNVMLNDVIQDFYRHSAGPHQHHEMARMRAAETRRWLVRSTNTGVSGFIDPFGQQLFERSDQFVDNVITGTVTARRGLTPFIFLHHWLLVALCIGLIILAIVMRKPSDAYPAEA